MNRRHLLAYAAALGATPALGASAAAKGGLVVVKALLFSCPICRATEGFDPAIAKELAAVGGRLVHAPLPNGSGARERVYFAVRDMVPAAEPAVRDSLYRGTQDAGLPLADDVQVMVWLQTDLGDQLRVDWTQVIEHANTDVVKAAVGRAARLAIAAAVSDVPAYVIVRAGEIVESIDPGRAPGGGSALREMVLSRIRVLSQPTKR